MNLKRNFLSLFDSIKNEVARLDVSIGISLADKGEQARIQNKLERVVHPYIPNAIVKNSTDQQVFTQAPQPRSGALDELDPTRVIRDNTIKSVSLVKEQPVVISAKKVMGMPKVQDTAEKSLESEEEN